MSRRAMRMERHHRKHKSVVSLNLVSLMDIFTILVFFLLVNSSDVESLPSTRLISLPESLADQQPRQTVTVIVTPEDILVEGQALVRTADVVAGQGVIARLHGTLEALLSEQSRKIPAAHLEVTVMADKSIPYRVLKRVMLSSQEAKFSKVSLAVIQDVAE